LNWCTENADGVRIPHSAGATGRVARRTKLGDDGNQIGAHSALLAASKQGEDGRIPHLNGSFPVFSLGWTIGAIGV
jgi:hypothetical protein